MEISIRDATLVAAGFRTVGEGLDFLGLSSVELAVDRDHQVSAIRPGENYRRMPIETDDDVEELRRHLEDTGVTVSAFLLSNDFGRADLDREIAWVTRTVEAAGALGIPVVRIDAVMHGEHDRPVDERQRRFVEVVTRILNATAEMEVCLGIENHGAQGNDPAFLSGLFAEVGHPRFGLTLDTGNFYWSGMPLTRVYEVIAQFAPYARHTHVKNIGYPPSERERERELGWRYADFVCPLEEGDIDLERVHSILRDAGYDAALCIEDESLGRFAPTERREVLRRDVAYLQRILGA
jgi:sugar phosphate isomerase/epimerase